MKWRRKAWLANVIAALPRSDAIYYRIQRSLGSLRHERFDPSQRLEAAVKIIQWAQELGHPVENRSFLEVGTGRTIDIPLALWLCGANRVVTIDLNTYLVEELIRESVAYLCRSDQIDAIFGELAARPQFKERLDQLSRFNGRLQDLLEMTGVEYHAPSDASSLKLPDRSIDFHISYTVLEHIPDYTLPLILREARRVLTLDGLLLHIIDPSDHFAHDDDSITAINFLQFSDREWTRLAGNKFAYHNRLRAYEYVRLFERAGIRLLGRLETIDDESLSVLRHGFHLDERFRQIDDEELAVRSIILMGSSRPMTDKQDAQYVEEPVMLPGRNRKLKARHRRYLIGT